MNEINKQVPESDQSKLGAEQPPEAKHWLRAWRAGEITAEELGRRCRTRLSDTSDGTAPRSSYLPTWAGGENSRAPFPASQLGLGESWNLPAEEIASDEKLVRWVHALLERLTRKGTRPVVVASSDLAWKLGAEASAVARVLAHLKANGILACDEPSKLTDPQTISLWSPEDQSARLAALDRKDAPVAGPHLLEEEKQVGENAVEEPELEAAPGRGEASFASRASARLGLAGLAKAKLDEGVRSQAPQELGSNSLPQAKPSQASPGNQATRPVGNGAAVKSDPTSATKPTARLRRAAEIARLLGDTEHVELYVSVLEHFPPSIVEPALNRALVTPGSEIRTSRSALFRYLLRRIGREKHVAERERDQSRLSNARGSATSATTPRSRP